VKSVPEVAADVAKATVEAVQSASKATESAVKKSVSQVKDAFDELTSRELWEEAEQVRRERLGLDVAAKPEQPAGLNIKPAPPERRSYTPPPPEVTVAKEQDDDEAYEEVYPSKMSNTSKIIVGFLVVATCVILYLIFFNTTSEELQVVGQSQPVVPVFEKEDTTVDTTAAPVSAVGDSMTLTLTAKEQVWISITPDDRPGYRGMLEAGMSKTFVAGNQYLLYLGNQHALDIMFDGRKLSQLPSIPNSKIVVRGLVLTRDKVYTDTASIKAAAPPAPPPAAKVEDTVKKSPPPVAKRKEPEVKRLPGPVRIPIPETPLPKVDTGQ
jgi:hypothetical protein